MAEQTAPIPVGSKVIREQNLLLKTKLSIPPARPRIIDRPRLYTQLQHIPQRQLTLISAPAGFGKTTLLRSWCTTRASQNPRVPVAWLSLDKDDNDPTTFWYYLIAALQSLSDEIDDEIIDLLFAPQPPPANLILTMLINRISEQSSPLILILDDYHVIETEELQRGLIFLLEHLPERLHLVIASRTVPALPLARLRAQGQLLELSMADLRFTSEETHTFFETLTDLALSPEIVTDLDRRIEGWIVGLHLAALALQGHEDEAAFIATFTGKHRHILDYLVGEVLHQQPEEIQRFLLFTSILERLHADLCDALLAQPCSQRMLHTLERTNLFIVPLDEQREWYRYHHLFVDALYNQLQHTYPDQVQRLHQQASLWYAQQGFTLEALRHALAAHDVEYAADLLEREAHTTPAIWTVSRLKQFSSYLQAIPRSFLKSKPHLCMLYTWLLLLQLASGKIVDTEFIATLLHDTETSLNGTASSLSSGMLATLHAISAYVKGDLDTTTQQALHALELLPQGHMLRTGAANILFNAYKTRGDTAAAAHTIEELATTSLQTHDIHGLLGALFNLGQLQALQGQLHQAAVTYRRAIALKEQTFPQGFPEMSAVGLSDILLEWNDVEAAAQYLLPEVALTQEHRDTQFLLACYNVLPRLEMARGNIPAAFAAHEELCHIIRQYPVFTQSTLKDSLYHLLDAQHADLSLEAGELSAALRWASSYTPPDHEPLNQYHLQTLTILARIHLANHLPDQALAVLERPLRTAEEARYILILIPLLALQAIALSLKGDHQQARNALARTLSQAESGGFIRSFLREGKRMHDLLQALLATPIQQSPYMPSPIYINQILHAFGAEHSQKTPERTPLASEPELLSGREREVLRYIADGLSDREIAQKLFLAESTVKTYARRIYGKLDAKNRTQAVTRARALRCL